jgi:hypothetical protein
MPPSNPQNLITYFAETDARNKRVKFGIKAKDRTRHVHSKYLKVNRLTE